MIKQNRVSAKELATRFGFATKGEDREIRNLGKLRSPKGVLMSFAETRNYLEKGLSKSNVNVLVINKKFGNIRTDKMLILTDNPRLAFYQIHNYLIKETDFYGKKVKSTISLTANIHNTAFVSKYNVTIGDRVIISPNVTILENSIIGNDSVIQPGTVIGSEGFECVHFKTSVLFVRHGGGIKIGERVEIGSCSCVDKYLFRGNTIIGDDTKIDNLVHIGHGAIIGKRVVIPANSGIGPSRIGDDVCIGFSSTILGGLKIGNRAFISIGAIVTKDVPEDTQVTGNFAINHKRFIRHLKMIR